MKALRLLGGLTPAQFLRRHWQKKPLLIRQALPGFEAPVTRAEMLRLAAHEDCHARLIWRTGKRWHLRHGPIARADFTAFTRPSSRAKPWTVLVQDIHHVNKSADALLRLFDFIPYARLDDLMASFASAGGGVGPHVDSYDVFLLQGEGTRRWQISQQRDLSLVTDAPIKLLASFQPEQEWLLEPGDMLYLPPGVAHCGTAHTDCITYSIGFRAPSHAALQQGWLQFLEDRCADERLYSDPDLRPSRQPAAINRQFLGYCQRILEGVEWHKSDMVMFLGQYLSEPKANTFFAPPVPKLSEQAFLRTARSRGIALHAKTRMLYRGADIFINGAHLRAGSEAALMRRLADTRALGARELRTIGTAKDRTNTGASTLFQWYAVGYLTPA
jgi:50S ribosomal protein L16 3-hydroxylase